MSRGAVIRVEREGPVAFLVLASPPRNALDAALLAATDGCLTALEQAPPRALVVFGEGDTFSGGVDLEELARRPPAAVAAMARDAQQFLERIEAFPCPVIAAINGDCLGGGLELALACHIRLVAAGAKLALPEVTLGLVPALGGMQRLAAAIGRARAYELIHTGRRCDTDEAARIGLVNAVFQRDALHDAAQRLARRIAGKPPAAVGAVLDCMRADAAAPAESRRRERAALEMLLAAHQLRTPIRGISGRTAGKPRGE